MNTKPTTPMTPPAVPPPDATEANQAIQQIAPTPQPAPTSQSAPADANLGILGHIAIHALAGAVRGMQAQQAPAPAAGDASAPGAADEPVVAPDAPDSAEAATSAKTEQPAQNPRGQSQPVDRRTLAMAQMQHHALQNLKLAHAISEAKRVDPSQLPALETQARNAQVAFAQNAESLGLTKIASGLRTYAEANEMGLAKKLGRGQILPLANPDGSVYVYELSPDAMYAPTTKPIEIRRPIGLDAGGTVKWETVGIRPPGSLTKMEALTQIILPEQRAAAELIRSAMAARDGQ